MTYVLILFYREVDERITTLFTYEDFTKAVTSQSAGFRLTCKRIDNHGIRVFEAMEKLGFDIDVTKLKKSFVMCLIPKVFGHFCCILINFCNSCKVITLCVKVTILIFYVYFHDIFLLYCY